MRLNTLLDRLLLPALLALATALGSTAAGAAGVTDSVVKVIAGENIGTGFVWQGQRGKYIATSLHTLAGAERVFYDRPLTRNELEVYRVDRESDLALLRPKNGELAHPALQLGNAEPVDGRRYWIYGFPAGVLTVQGDDIEFSRTKHNRPMNEYLPEKTVSEITARGFPQPTVKLLRVSSGLTPGHSGAPIVDESDGNKVIGIGAGGLSHVGFRRVNWAVPAEVYLPALERAGAAENVARLSSTADKRQFGLRTEAAAPPIESEVAKYYHVDRVSFADLLESMNDDELETYEQILSSEDLDDIYDEAEEEGYDLSAPINVFQNTQTGAMVFIPAAIPRDEITMDGDLLIAGRGQVQMFLQLVETDSFDAALAAKDAFVEFLDDRLRSGSWPRDPRWTDSEPLHYPDAGYWERSIYKYLEMSGEDISELDIHLEIEYDEEYGEFGDFLGVAVYGKDFRSFNASDDELLFLVANCAWVSGFVLD